MARGAASASLAALRRLKRRLEVERAFVERAAGNSAADPLALITGKLLDVLKAVDPPAGDDRDLQLARELDRRLDVDASKHAVAADVGVHNCFDAVILELFRQIENIVSAHLRPAVGSDFALSGIQADDDVAGKRVASVVQEAGILHRGSADDDVADAVVEISLDGVQIPDPAAQLDRDFLTDDAHHLADRQLVFWLSGERPVQVDQVQTLRP